MLDTTMMTVRDAAIAKAARRSTLEDVRDYCLSLLAELPDDDGRAQGVVDVLDRVREELDV